MTARISCKALKADSPDTRFLESFLEYIDRWEESAKPSGGGFLTDSTATGLRVKPFKALLISSLTYTRSAVSSTF